MVSSNNSKSEIGIQNLIDTDEEKDKNKKNQKPSNYYFDNGKKIDIDKPNIDKLPKIVIDTAKVVIRDNFSELDMMYDELPEEFL